MYDCSKLPKYELCEDRERGFHVPSLSRAKHLSGVMSVRPNVTTQLLPDGFQQNLILGLQPKPVEKR
jgi:hypothetical protein